MIFIFIPLSSSPQSYGQAWGGFSSSMMCGMSIAEDLAMAPEGSRISRKALSPIRILVSQPRLILRERTTYYIRSPTPTPSWSWRGLAKSEIAGGWRVQIFVNFPGNAAGLRPRLENHWSRANSTTQGVVHWYCLSPVWIQVQKLRINIVKPLIEVFSCYNNWAHDYFPITSFVFYFTKVSVHDGFVVKQIFGQW